MIISYVFPFELTQTQMFADTEKDFEKIVVNTSGYVASNKFLVSLWNQVNTQICPNHSVDRAPWAYFPGKFIGKKECSFCSWILSNNYRRIILRFRVSPKRRYRFIISNASYICTET